MLEKGSVLIAGGEIYEQAAKGDKRVRKSCKNGEQQKFGF